jgi:hypothetical protein
MYFGENYYEVQESDQSMLVHFNTPIRLYLIKYVEFPDKLKNAFAPERQIRAS